jgi:hypothetical protein
MERYTVSRSYSVITYLERTVLSFGFITLGYNSAEELALKLKRVWLGKLDLSC